MDFMRDEVVAERSLKVFNFLGCHFLAGYIVPEDFHMSCVVTARYGTGLQ